MTFEIPDPKKIEIPDSIYNIISLCDEAKKDFDTSGELTDERQEEIWLKAKDDRLVSSAQIENIMVRKGVPLQFANLQSLEYAETKNIDEKELLNLLIADKELYERAKQVFWLNPEGKYRWDTGDSVMKTYSAYCTKVFQCGNIDQLERVISTLLRTAI